MTDDRLKEIEKWWMTHWSESGGMVATPDAHVVSFELIGEVKRLRGVLRQCLTATHSWVVTEESAICCDTAFKYIRDVAEEALGK